MNKIKSILANLDTIALKIMKVGLVFCFLTSILSFFILYIFLLNHSIFLFNLGLSIFKLSTYLSVEFIICGIIADKIKEQI